MNWIHFLLWLAGIYFLYYFAVILWDTLKNKNPQHASGRNELTFSEQIAPHDATALVESPQTPVAAQTHSTPEMIASGGVPLKDIFGLARKEAIVYLKEVSFN